MELFILEAHTIASEVFRTLSVRETLDAYMEASRAGKCELYYF